MTFERHRVDSFLFSRPSRSLFLINALRNGIHCQYPTAATSMMKMMRSVLPPFTSIAVLETRKRDRSSPKSCCSFVRASQVIPFWQSVYQAEAASLSSAAMAMREPSKYKSSSVTLLCLLSAYPQLKTTAARARDISTTSPSTHRDTIT